MYSKLFAVALLALTQLLPSAESQVADQSRRFNGKWQAKVDGSVVCTINLQVKNEIFGSMQDCRIHTDGDGNLLESEPNASAKPSPISNARIVGPILTFEYKDEGDIASFQMKLLGDDIAELKIQNAPVKIKPIRFVRSSMQ